MSGDTFACRQGPHNVDASPDGRLIAITRPPADAVAAVGDAVLVAVHGSGRVVAVSARGRIARSVRVGAGPHRIAVVPLSG